MTHSEKSQNGLAEDSMTFSWLYMTHRVSGDMGKEGGAKTAS